MSASGLATAIRTGNTVSAGNSITVNFSLGSPGTISGTVTQADGVTPISSATVSAIEGTTAASDATTDSSGNYSMSDLGAGNYNVQASASGYKPQTQSDLAVTSGNTTTANFSLPGQSVITYAYDELGRLTGVVDSQGDAAIYTYDAVGNITSIARNASSEVSISNFFPQSGPVGTSVTINGAGFSATAGQDTVSFNGTSSSVTSATATQIVTVVPSAASTGPITVTAPAGTVTTSSSFSVGSSISPPTISSFSPTVVAAGAAVSITGTNFDVSPTNDAAAVNITKVVVASATQTNLGVTVPPNATSGHVSVSTAAGRAVTSADLFVVPAGYTVSSLEFTARTSIGTPVNFSASANGFGLVLFDGSAGESIGLNTTGTCSSYQVLGVYGTILANWSCSGSGGEVVLPATGTYTVELQFSSSGSGTLNIGTPPAGTNGTISIGGPSVTAQITSPGQAADLVFSATAQQTITLVGSNNTCGCEAYLYASDGNPISTSARFGGTYYTMDHVVLPYTGQYTLHVFSPTNSTGSSTLQLYSAADLTGSIQANGQTETITLTQPLQIAKISFDGTVGQPVSAKVGGVIYYTAELDGPDGSTIGTFELNSSPGFLDKTILPTTGSYTIVVHVQDPTATSFQLTLYDVPPDVTGPITAGGSQASLTTTVPGQSADFTFSGTAGQRVSVVGGPYDIVDNWQLLGPDGSVLETTSVATSYGGYGYYLDTVTLETAGTYTILAHSTTGSTGTFTATLYNVPPDVTDTVTIGGPAVIVTTTVPGQNAQLTFSATSGQHVTASVTNSTLSSTGNAVWFTLLDPNGNTLSRSAFSYISSFTGFSMSLSTAGTYTILVDPIDMSTGSLTLTLTSP